MPQDEIAICSRLSRQSLSVSRRIALKILTHSHKSSLITTRVLDYVSLTTDYHSDRHRNSTVSVSYSPKTVMRVLLLFLEA